MKNLIIIAALLLTSVVVKAQIYNYMDSYNQYGDTVILCTGEPLYMSASGSFLFDDFNTGTLSNLWSSSCSPMFNYPCVAPVDGSIYLWVGDASCFPRDMTTIPINVAPNSQISFDLIFATQGGPSPCEGPDEMDEGVCLQWSTDNGATWNDITYFCPDGNQYPSNAWIGQSIIGTTGPTSFTTWGNYNFTVPLGAVSPGTRFRWHQEQVTDQEYDHWGIDNVHIGNIPCSFSWFENGSLFSQSRVLPPIHPDSTTVYSIESICGTDTSYDSLIIMVDTSCLNINGYVYEDASLDCNLDSGEGRVKYVPIHLFHNSALQETKWTDQNGYYEFSNLNISGAYEVIIGQIPYSCLDVECPSSGSYLVDTSSSPMNFSLQNIPGFDLSVYASCNGFAPGFHSYICPYINSSCDYQPGQLLMVHHDTLVQIQYYSMLPTQIDGDSVFWDFTYVSDLASLYIYTLTNQAASLGHQVCFDFYVLPSQGDLDTTNNYFPLCMNVVGSIDPNNKHVSPLGTGYKGLIQPDVSLTYTINFQNTGTAPAQNVVLLDTLDANLNLQSVQLLDYSHPVEASMIGNILEFRFNNIMLPDSGTDYNASMGHVIYKVDQNPGLAQMTQIYNNAAIFFDYNEPVITNFTLNTIEYPVSVVMAKQDNHQVKLYPNPANNVINIESTAKFNLSIFDIYGHLVLIKNNCAKQSSVDVSQFKSGLYIIQINSENFVETARVIKL